jgi:oligoribonuclease (3'-5' exoribonuclease)
VTLPRNDLILFCDLETTGTDRDLDSIIEVGISVVTWPAFNEVFARSYLVLPTDEAWERAQAKDVVRDMHKANGLTEDIEKLRSLAPEYREAFTPENVDGQIDTDLSMFGSRGSSHIPLAGSGISHFDRPFIKRYLPLFDARCSHWHYDVGVLRRMFLLAGARYADDSGKTHRALDDARVHAEEFRFYMDRITEMFGALRAEADAAKVTAQG